MSGKTLHLPPPETLIFAQYFRVASRMVTLRSLHGEGESRDFEAIVIALKVPDAPPPMTATFGGEGGGEEVENDRLGEAGGRKRKPRGCFLGSENGAGL